MEKGLKQSDQEIEEKLNPVKEETEGNLGKLTGRTTGLNNRIDKIFNFFNQRFSLDYQRFNNVEQRIESLIEIVKESLKRDSRILDQLDNIKEESHD